MLLIIAPLFFIILLALCGLSIGFGFLLHWIVPAVELGIGILTGVVAISVSIHFVARILNLTADEPDDGDIVIKPVRVRRGSRRKKPAAND